MNFKSMHKVSKLNREINYLLHAIVEEKFQKESLESDDKSKMYHKAIKSWLAKITEQTVGA